MSDHVEPVQLVEIPTAAFVGRLDVSQKPLPSIDFYLMKRGKPERIREANQPFSALALTLYPTIWIREEDFSSIKGYTEAILANPKLASALNPEKRAEMLRKSAMLVMGDLFENPSPENISRSLKVVGSFVYLILKDPKTYNFLSDLSSHDPYTLQHSVGTAVNCIMLAKKTGIANEEDLQEIGIAGLLHDIGKVKVKKEIINKSGPLDDMEWEEMRSHAEEGYNIIKDHPGISERTKLAILQHHEDKNGTGYPRGLTAERVEIYAKIVSICDIYNALTTNRTYSKARTPFEAFHFMRTELIHKVDDRLFKELVLIYGGKTEELPVAPH